MSNTPFPGTKIEIENETEPSYLNTGLTKVDIRDRQVSITVLEDEERLNQLKQNILVLKPEYLGVLLGDMRDMMRYDKSTDTIDEFTKKTYNPNLS